MSDVFYLKADKQMAENSNWSFIPHLKDNFEGPLKLSPTLESIEARHLIWEIPDNEHNRLHIKRYYHNFNVFEENPAEKKVTKKAEVKAAPEIKKAEVKKVEVETVEEDAVDTYLPTNPKEMEMLKAKIKAELDADGIPYAKTASLKILRELQKNAR